MDSRYRKRVYFSLGLLVIFFVSIFSAAISNILPGKSFSWDIDEEFENQGDIFWTEVDIESRATLHTLLNFTTSNEPTIVFSVIDITNGNNTEIWSAGHGTYTKEFPSARTLNVTVEATDSGAVYPAPFKLLAYVSPITTIVNEDNYLWEETFFYSGDFHYLELLFNGITLVSVKTTFTEIAEQPDIDLEVRATPEEFGYWAHWYQSKQGEEIEFCQTLMPDEKWILFFQTIGDPLLYPLNFTVEIETIEATTVTSTSAIYHGSLTEENNTFIYQLPVDRAPINLRVKCESNYTITLTLFNETASIFEDWHSGWSYTFPKTGNYFLQGKWEPPNPTNDKNNYTLRLQLGIIELTLVPEELLIVEDSFFFGLDKPEYEINIPTGTYQLKILEMGERHMWAVNLTGGTTENWQNFYYEIIIIIPPFPTKVFQWKELIYSKLINQASTLRFALDKKPASDDYKVGFLLRNYKLAEGTADRTITGTLRNANDYDYWSISLTEETTFDLNLNPSSDMANLTIQIETADHTQEGLWVVNNTYGVHFEPMTAGTYYIKIESPFQEGDYSLQMTFGEKTSTPRFSGYKWELGLVSILLIEVICIIRIRKKGDLKIKFSSK
ncbi:MAG: hypothetical protein ACFFDI_24575 [Promethearchaeota archaeon]